MKKIFIIVNKTKPNAMDIYEKVVAYLEHQNVAVASSIKEENVECIITIGGDGTMVRSLKENQKMWSIGINAGNLGFLTEINIDNLYWGLDKLISNDFYIERCISLECTLKRQNKVIYNSNVINDVVLSRSNALDMVRFNVKINDKHIKQYNADGFIVSTPLGASAYALSCGGPLVEPSSKLIELTPIAPHSLINRSLVVDDTRKVSIDIIDSRNNKQNTLLCIDGQEPIELFVGDVIEVKKSVSMTNLLRLQDDSFVENIAKKMILN